ncbi:MAG TPA: DNA-formamidopyrimidine glycosylase family protein [Solirubrobacteraceae bacterium]
MPEGDTIHHAAGRIRPVLLGKVPDQIAAPQRRHSLQRWPERLQGCAVEAVEVHGKHLFLRFEGGLTLHSHLRMTGAWGVYRKGRPWRRSPSRAWLVLSVGDSDVVQFDGPLLELLTESQLRRQRRIANLGQDLLAEDFDESRFLQRLQMGSGSRTLGEALLDQRVVAGIGNVWKSEACFAAGIDPSRPIGEVEPQEALAIVAFARSQMAHSAIAGVGARPQAVYGRRGLPCPRCGERILSRGQGVQNRTTFWCPRCQA